MATQNVSWLDWLTMTLVIIGGLNWGLVGAGIFLDGNWNVVNLLFGGIFGGAIEAAIYVIVGLAGLYQVYFGYRIAGDTTVS